MNTGKLVIGFAGDVMIGRNVNEVMNGMGYRYIWGDVFPLLLRTDLNIANLETTLTHGNRKVPKVFNFKATPDKVVALTDANFRMVNLANNHILDFSEEGLVDTLKTLDAPGIQHVGAGMNETEATKAALFKKNGLTLGLLGFTDNEPGWKATAAKPGVNYINISNRQDRETALLHIEEINNEVDIVIVSIHWGPNLQAYPSPLFIDFAHQMTERGATIIHGHSAHNFQGIDVHNGKLILYDTGDFMDDYVVHAKLKNDHSFFFEVEVTKEGVKSARLTPVLIANCQVNQATGADHRWSLLRMQELSAQFGTNITDGGEVIMHYQPQKITNA